MARKKASLKQYEIAARKQLYTESFADFVRAAWPAADPTPLRWSTYMQHICEHLQAVESGDIQKLIINIPPGHAKSLLVSVLFPVWLWIRAPETRLLTASYDLKLSMRDAVRSRALINSQWFRETFGTPFEMQDDQNVKSYYANSANGFRMALSVGGGSTGHRGDMLIIDDPIAANDAHSQLARENVVTWKTQTMSSRFNDPAKAREILVMQRLHEEDLTGYLLKHGGWEHLCLPSEFEPSRAYKTSVGSDWRTVEGELLFPEMFSKEILATAKSGAGMGAMAYAGQHQQRPAPAQGGILKRDWFKTYRDLPQSFDKVVLVADCAFKGTKDSDRVALQVWAKKGVTAYLIDQRWGNMGFTDTINRILELKGLYPKISQILIEDKANGSAIIEVLSKRIPGVTAVNPEGGKEARVHAITSFLEAGNVYFPGDAPWFQEFLAECLSFPRGAHDDAVDAMAYALYKLLNVASIESFKALASFQPY